MKLGEILLSQGLIKEEQLAQAFTELEKSDKGLVSILVKLGIVSNETLSSLLGSQIETTHRKRIGEVLVEFGLITEKQLVTGLAEQQISRQLLGKCLVKLGFITEDKLFDALGAQLDLPHVKLENFSFSQKLIASIPLELLQKYKAVPLFEKDGIVTLAMTDPTNQRTIDHFKSKMGKDIDPVIASEKDILRAIDRNCPSTVEQQEETVQVTVLDSSAVIPEEKKDSLVGEVTTFINRLISDAISERVTDIHMEPMEAYFRLRFRIDDQLVEKNQIPQKLFFPLIYHLKMLAFMDPEKMDIPQEGFLQMRDRNEQLTIFVATYPVWTYARGLNEKIILRILNTADRLPSLRQLGLSNTLMEAYTSLMSLPEGVILVAGPKGGGKSTTLYATLQHILQENGDSKNIVTIENPIKTVLDGVNQGQFNPTEQLSFTQAIKSVLRQDPDIIMISSIQEKEACEVTLHAGLSGHLVFSALPRFDAIDGFSYLISMGVRPSLLVSAVKGIMAQRILKKICQFCKTEYDADPYLLKRADFDSEARLFRGNGCKLCNNTGYNGTVGLFELLIFDKQIERMIIEKKPADRIKKHCLQQESYRTLRRDGLNKVLQGLVRLEEVLEVTPNE